jgi:hypothetical protein
MRGARLSVTVCHGGRQSLCSVLITHVTRTSVGVCQRGRLSMLYACHACDTYSRCRVPSREPVTLFCSRHACDTYLCCPVHGGRQSRLHSDHAWGTYFRCRVPWREPVGSSPSCTDARCCTGISRRLRLAIGATPAGPLPLAAPRRGCSRLARGRVMLAKTGADARPRLKNVGRVAF